jgi:hypothetical protein
MTMKIVRGGKIRKLRVLLAVALAASAVLITVTAQACPKGYAPCGERSQLCCPKP